MTRRPSQPIQTFFFLTAHRLYKLTRLALHQSTATDARFQNPLKTFVFKRKAPNPLRFSHKQCVPEDTPIAPHRSRDGTARQDGLRRDEPGAVVAAKVAAPPGVLRPQPRRLPPGRRGLRRRRRRRRRGRKDVARRLHPGRVPAPLPLPPLRRRDAPLPRILHRPPPLLRPAALGRRGGGRALAPPRARQRRRERRGRRRRGGGRRPPRVAVAVEVLRPGCLRVRRRLRLLLAGAVGREQVLQAPRRRQERGVRVVPHPGRDGPDGRAHEDDVGQRDGEAAVPQPGHLLRPPRHRRALPPLLRRPHRRLRKHEGVLPGAEERAGGDGVRGGEAGPAIRRGRQPAQQAQQRPPRPRGGARQARLRAPGARAHPRPPPPVQVLPPGRLPPRRARGAPRQARARRRRPLRVPRREVTVERS